MTPPRKPKKSRVCWRRAWMAASMANLGSGLKLCVFWAALDELQRGD